jgi:glucose/arabinose dehydrogenase
MGGLCLRVSDYYTRAGGVQIRRTSVAALAASCCLVFTLAGSATVSNLPTGFVDTLVAFGLNSPTAMAFAPGGRLFVAEQGGALRVIKNGELLGQPFVSLKVDSTGERGLLGVALDPGFPQNPYIYLYFTVPGSPPHNRVARFTISGDHAVTGSQLTILDIDPLSGATNHNGGAIHFGKDGKLYVAVGDNANGSNAQSLSNLKGKILRINKDGSIPTDNPFFNVATGKNRAIWALGLRNPFTFAFQNGTGRMFIDDVGEGSFEEIDDGVAGSNYGWPTCEGPCANPSFRNPVLHYAHNGTPTPNGCAIIGGAFYNPAKPNFPSAFVNKYFFTDLCSGWIERTAPGGGFRLTHFGDGLSSPVQIDLGPDGALYYLERGAERVHRISWLGVPTISRIVPTSGRVGSAVEIDGTYLAGATSVKFHGTTATFTIVSDGALVARVPAGATTGTVTVTTARPATATSPTSFTVTP